MINYFKKILTGYSSEKKTVNGLEYRYQYAVKPIWFDPMLMLRELTQRLEMEEIQKFPFHFSSGEMSLFSPVPKDLGQPTVICTISRKDKDLKVTRFTAKEGLYPISCYLFEANGKPFGQFIRKYDYGSTLWEKAKILEEKAQVQVDLKREKWLFSNEKGEQLFLEKFGHTQFWELTDLHQLQFWSGK